LVQRCVFSPSYPITQLPNYPNTQTRLPSENFSLPLPPKLNTMENLKETYNNDSNNNESNNPSHYMLMTAGIAVVMLGVLLRFAGTFAFVDAISNVILIVGVIICLKSVKSILQQ
jgi:hypothetical protein